MTKFASKIETRSWILENFKPGERVGCYLLPDGKFMDPRILDELAKTENIIEREFSGPGTYGHVEFYRTNWEIVEKPDPTRRISKSPIEDLFFFDDQNGESQCYKEADLKAAFDHVADPEDWRDPIDYVIDSKDLDVTVAAIEFYTATKAEIIRSKNESVVRIKSPGYRNGPAGP